MNWKSLFVKDDEDKNGKKTEPKNKDISSDSFSFPVNNTTNVQQPVQASQPINDPAFNEVLQVYENGLDSINMPGYDFFEFYKTVVSTGIPNEQTYQMAFQMAKTLDKTISPHKLLSDAEFYISKINEVHGQYVSQGQQKLNAINEKKTGEKNHLQSDIDNATRRINELRIELQNLESDINQKRNSLMKVDDTYYPQEKTIRAKLSANDMAKKTSIDKLNMIKEGIQRFIKT